MKKLLFIEANTTGTGMLALEKALNLNLHPVLLTNNPGRYKDLDCYECSVITCNTNNTEELIEVIQGKFERLEIAGVTTTSEFYIEAVATIAQRLELIGNPPSVVKNSRNKAFLRSLLKNKKEFYHPYFFQIQSIEDVIGIKERITYPCIVKPIDDSGSNGVKKCKDYAEVCTHVVELLKIDRNIRNQLTAKTILIEEFLEGLEYSIECFSVNGKHQVIGITKKTVVNDPYFVESEHVFPAPDVGHVQNSLVTAARTLLSEISWRNGPTHIEVRIINNQVALIELNGRLAGGMIPELINHASGIDLLGEQINVVVGKPTSLESNITNYAGIRFLVPNHSGVISLLDDPKQLMVTDIKERKLTVTNGDKVVKATNSYGRLGYVIAVNSDPYVLKKVLDDSLSNVIIKTEEKV